MRADISAHKFDKEKWGTELAPILNLWKKLNQVLPLFYITNTQFEYVLNLFVIFHYVIYVFCEA